MLEGQCAIVAGPTRGIGLRIARCLAASGRVAAAVDGAPLAQ
jgi:NAD(P)-dependent dehydrogenase (short-subunit alcohol dehydrogenase family)